LSESSSDNVLKMIKDDDPKHETIITSSDTAESDGEFTQIVEQHYLEMLGDQIDVTNVLSEKDEEKYDIKDNGMTRTDDPKPSCNFELAKSQHMETVIPDLPEDECTIDPETLKNVDGHARQRKGKSRFKKRQSSKDDKSPARIEKDESIDEEDKEKDNIVLSSKLEETSVQMKRIEEAFSTLSDSVDNDEILDLGKNGQENREDHFIASGTTVVSKPTAPIDEVIGQMIQQTNLQTSTDIPSNSQME